MKYNPISVTDLNKYIKDRIAEDEMLNNVFAVHWEKHRPGRFAATGHKGRSYGS